MPASLGLAGTAHGPWHTAGGTATRSAEHSRRDHLIIGDGHLIVTQAAGPGDRQAQATHGQGGDGLVWGRGSMVTKWDKLSREQVVVAGDRAGPVPGIGRRDTALAARGRVPPVLCARLGPAGPARPEAQAGATMTPRMMRDACGDRLRTRKLKQPGQIAAPRGQALWRHAWCRAGHLPDQSDSRTAARCSAGVSPGACGGRAPARCPCPLRPAPTPRRLPASAPAIAEGTYSRQQPVPTPSTGPLQHDLTSRHYPRAEAI